MSQLFISHHRGLLSSLLVLLCLFGATGATPAPDATRSGGLSVSGSPSPEASGPPGVRLATVRKGSFVQQVQLVGDVEAQTQIYLTPIFSSKLQMLAEDGANVKKNAVVARLDAKTVEDDLGDQVLSAEVARSALIEQERSAAADKVRLNAEIQRAQAGLEQKSLALRQLEAGTRPEELRKQALNRDLANRALALSRSSLALKEKLAAKGISSQLEVLQARLDLTNKERDQRVAEANYKQAVIGATPLSRQIAQLDQAKARRQVAWSRQALSLAMQLAAQNRAKLLAQQSNANGRLKLLQSQVQHSVFHAPIAGTVVLSKTWTQQGLKRVNVGDDVWEGNPFMSVADLSKVVIRSELDETLLRNVKIGMSCTIQLPSLRGRSFSGKVSRIGVLAHERSKRQNTEGLSKVFDLDILPASSKDTIFKPGTSVDIQLPLIQRAQVLVLPREAISRSGSRTYVLLADGSERTVSIGDASPKEVVITQGLSAGEQVRLPEASSDSTAQGTPAGTEASP